MKKGRITEQIQKRSVSKRIEHFRREVLHGAAGDDCAIFAFSQGAQYRNTPAADHVQAVVAARTAVNPQTVAAAQAQTVAAAQAQTVYAAPGSSRYVIHAAVNQAAAAGYRAAAVLLSILLPEEEKEEQLRAMITEARTAAGALGAEIADVKVSVTAAVNQAIVTATVLGAEAIADAAAETVSADAKADTVSGTMPTSGRNAAPAKKAAPGMEVVMTKWAGLSSSAILATEQKAMLLQRYPSYLLEEAAGFDRYLSVVPEAAVAAKSDVCSVCAASEGGIFKALWTLAAHAGVGLEIMLKKIPIRQETVEICNYLDVNPYELAADGSLLCITGHGEALVGELAKAGIKAAVIGTVTDNNDRVIVNGEERRFLEPSKADEIYKIL